MAAQPAKATKSVIVDEDSEKEIQVDVQSVAKLQEFLHSYRPPSDVKRDHLGEHFRIELNQPLAEFESKNARAYIASDLTNPARRLFAHVCLPGTAQRYRAIAELKSLMHPGLTQIVACGPVELSQPLEERLVIIYERPDGIKLSELLQKNPDLRNQNFLCTNIIGPLIAAINQLGELGLSHGSINHNTIYIQNMAMLAPAVAEPCGYSQMYYYDTLERMQCLPSGKGEGTTAHDYYALAVLSLYVLHGPEYFANFTPERLPYRILQEGIYNTFLPNEDAPEMFFDFFRGIFCENSVDRWDYGYIRPWLDGKRYNVLPPPSPVETARPFEYADISADTRRQISYALTKNWDKIPEVLQSGKLSHWVAISLRNRELTESIARIANSVAEINSKNEIQLNEQFMRAILILDPHAPIHLGKITFNIDGIDTLYAELYLSKSQELASIIKYIEFNMSNFWLDQQRKNPEYEPPPLYSLMLTKLDRVRAFIRNNSMGFGPERTLYELNPDMACQSPLLGGSYIATLPALLKRLDQLAPSMSKESDPLDRHIAAFITSKLGIQHELHINELSANPTLASNRSILSLYLLSMVHDKVGVTFKYPGLTHWLGARILPLLEDIHSRTLRQKIKNLLMDKARLGRLTSLADLVINNDYATADRNGFNQAWNKYHANAIKIEQYRSEALIDKQSMRVGFSFAKTIAYIALLISIITSMRLI